MALGAITPNQSQNAQTLSPITVARQAGSGTTANSSLSSGSSESSGFFSMLLKPFKMVGEFFAWVFKSLLCCCFYGGRDLKADIALIKEIVDAKPTDVTQLKAQLTKLYDLPERIQKDVVQAHVNEEMGREVDLRDTEAVAVYKKDHADNITKWEKEVTEFFSKKDMKANFSDIIRLLADVQVKLEKEDKPESSTTA